MDELLNLGWWSFGGTKIVVLFSGLRGTLHDGARFNKIGKAQGTAVLCSFQLQSIPMLDNEP